MLIYLVTNLMNDKKYIGQTIQSLDERMRLHYKDTKRRNNPFSNALKKYSPESFWRKWAGGVAKKQNAECLWLVLVGGKIIRNYANNKRLARTTRDSKD